jgi:hypothetical protein
MNRFYQAIELPKKKQPNLKCKKRVKNRSRPVIRPVGRGGGSPKRSIPRRRMNKRKGENEGDGEGRAKDENENEDDGEMGQSYPARRVKAS